MRLVLSFTLSYLLLAGAIAPARVITPHPCVLQLIINEAPYRVVGMKGQDPVYQQGEKLKRYRSKAYYEVGRARSYADASIEINDIKGSELLDTNGTRGGVTMLLTASETIRGGFAIIIAHNSGYSGNDVSPDATYFVRPLPDLPRGEEVKVNLVTMGSMMGYDYENPAAGRSFFPIIFAEGGKEIRTNWSDKIAVYYAQLTHRNHVVAKSNYLKKFAGADHPAVPFSTPLPVLPKEVSLSQTTINTLLEVSATGSVQSVSLDSTLDATVDLALRAALLEWLFLPRLKAGSPIPVRVEVPIPL